MGGVILFYMDVKKELFNKKKSTNILNMEMTCLYLHLREIISLLYRELSQERRKHK